MPYVSGMMVLLGGMPEWREQEPKKENGEMPRWDLDEKTAKHWADKKANGSLVAAVLLALAIVGLLAVLVLTTAAASGAEAVSIGMVPLSYGGGEVSTIKMMLWTFASVIGFALTIGIIVMVGVIGEHILSFLRSCFRRG